MSKFLHFFALIFIFFAAAMLANGKEKIFYIRLDHDIDDIARNRVTKAIADAEKANADYFILDLDTYGGELAAADSIRSAILRCGITTAAFINMQAASAGALISIACDSIYMREGSTIGAATVVNGINGQPMPDKYQSFMRGMMRSTAEATGRNPEIAQSMVDTAHVLSMTPTEAIKAGYCQGICESRDDVAKRLAGNEDYEYVEFSQTRAEKAAEGLMAVRFIFLMMIFGGLYVEFKTPGVGIPLIIAILGAILYFSPLYIVNLAQNWEIALFIVGLVLLGIELFVIPGFGVFGILGIIAIVVSLTFAAIDNSQLFKFDGSFNIKPILIPFGEVIISFVAAVFIGIYLVGKLYPTRAFNDIALRQSLEGSDGFVGVKTGLESLVGKEATVFTALKPSGKVMYEGKIYDAVIDVGYAEKGDQVIIYKAEQGRLYCKKA
jgi:membrane-bound serine protease (ClpP class)